MSDSTLEKLEKALDKLAVRVGTSSDMGLQKISNDISLAATYLGDGAADTACKILADEPR